MESFAGELLVAMPAIADGPFHRSVVLVLEHDEQGALGIIINQPLDSDVDDLLPHWTPLMAAPGCLFHGGPVEERSALAMGVLRSESEPVGWRQMVGKVGLVDLDAPVAVMSDALAGIRVFAGYAGWSPGQLEAEIAESAWAAVAAHDEDLMSPSPELLWRRVLRRQRGDLRLLATFPDDPDLN